MADIIEDLFTDDENSRPYEEEAAPDDESDPAEGAPYPEETANAAATAQPEEQKQPSDSTAPAAAEPEEGPSWFGARRDALLDALSPRHALNTADVAAVTAHKSQKLRAAYVAAKNVGRAKEAVIAAETALRDAPPFVRPQSPFAPLQDINGRTYKSAGELAWELEQEAAEKAAKKALADNVEKAAAAAAKTAAPAEAVALSRAGKFLAAAEAFPYLGRAVAFTRFTVTRAAPVVTVGVGVYEGYDAYKNHDNVGVGKAIGGTGLTLLASIATGAAIGTAVTPLVGTLAGAAAGVAGYYGGRWLGGKIVERNAPAAETIQAPAALPVAADDIAAPSKEFGVNAPELTHIFGRVVDSAAQKQTAPKPAAATPGNLNKTFGGAAEWTTETPAPASPPEPEKKNEGKPALLEMPGTL